MARNWNFFRSSEWAAVDSTPEGRTLGVRVRGGGARPIVVKCAQSSAVSMGAHALQEVAEQLGGARQWTRPLARGEYQMMVMPEPPVLESEMDSSLRWSLGSMIDFPPVEAVTSWMRIPSDSSRSAGERQMYVVVARESLVDEYAQQFEQAKLRLRAVDVRETALRNIAALTERVGAGAGLLTVSPSGIETTFTFKGELCLDRFIAQPMDEIIGGDEQRQQKFFDRLAQQVHQSLELIARNFAFVNIDRIHVGPSAIDRALVAHLGGKLSVPVQKLDLAALFDLSAAPQLATAENQSRYLVALGAALRDRRVAA